MNDTATTLEPRKGGVIPLLCVMMFLQYSVYGVWFPIASRFLSAKPDVGGLGFTDTQIGMIVALAGAIGAICAPFIAGQIADRYFATQRFLAILLLTGGVLKFLTAYQTTFAGWLLLSIVYAIVFMPTLALTNSLAMSHLRDPKRQFPGVRVYGTFGWVFVAWVFPMVWLQSDLAFRWLPPFFTGELLPDAPARMIDSLKIAGVISAGYAVFCWFALPHTPPKRDAVEKLAFAKAFRLIRRRSFAVLVCVSLIVAVIHVIYFLQTAKFLAAIGLRDTYIMPAMAIGQFAEMLIMIVLGRMLSRLGFRAVITMGGLAYFVRYMIFGYGAGGGLPLGVVVAAQFIHGFCFACFYAASFIYVDRIAPKDVRHSAQTVFMLVIFGLGPLIAGPVNGLLSKLFTPEGGTLDYGSFWYVLAVMGLTAAVLIAAFFRDETKDEAPVAGGGEE